MEITEQNHSVINTKFILISFVILGQISKPQFFLGASKIIVGKEMGEIM